MCLDVRPRASDGIYRHVSSYLFRDLAKKVGEHKKTADERRREGKKRKDGRGVH